jgi:hypothetical protein
MNDFIQRQEVCRTPTFLNTTAVLSTQGLGTWRSAFDADALIDQQI